MDRRGPRHVAGAENLTDRRTGALIRDAAFAGGNFVKLPEPGRLVVASFRWEL